MKHSRKLAKLAARQKDFDATCRGKQGFRRPGSAKK